jgi:hypothetical protein
MGASAMYHRGLCFLSLVLAALGLGPGLAHLLEMPVKLDYSPELYAAVTSTLYAFFGYAGALFQVGALASALALAYASRKHAGFRFAMAGASLLACSLILWGALVAPVNAAWARAIQDGSQPLPALYAQLRSRWEYGHVAAFVAWLAGYGLLQWFALGPGLEKKK